MTRRLYQLFAELAEYPTLHLADRVNECISLLTVLHLEAADPLKEFRTFLNQASLGQLEEIYTSTFDLNVIFYPYVGCHLFGDGSQRGMFLAGLREHYQGSHFSPGNELPDHLSVMLRFLAHNEDEEEREELIFLFIIPALRKMLEGLEGSGNPYMGMLQSLLLMLQSDTQVQKGGITANVGCEEFRPEKPQ